MFDVLGQQLSPGIRSWKELLTHGEEDWLRFDDLKTAQETTAARLFSSGTTGLPKAVAISHHNLVAENELAFEIRAKPYRVCKWNRANVSRHIFWSMVAMHGPFIDYDFGAR